MEIDKFKENDTFVCQLRTAIRDGAAGLSDVPGLLKCILKDHRWENRTLVTGASAPFERFEDFVRAKPLEGLGADMGLIERICADDPEAIELLRDARVAGGPGNPSGANQYTGPSGIIRITNDSSTDDAGYAIRRLRKSRPDLHAQVIAKELSPHAAMVTAGFRRRTVTVTVEPAAFARAARRHFTPDQIGELIAGLVNPPPAGSPSPESPRA